MEIFDGVKYHWERLDTIVSKSYKCGFCSNEVFSEKGYFIINSITNSRCGSVYICPSCNWPTLFTLKGTQIPGEPTGDSVLNVPDD